MNNPKNATYRPTAIVILLFFIFSCLEPAYDPEEELYGSWKYEYDQELDIIESSIDQRIIPLQSDGNNSIRFSGLLSVSGSYSYDFTKLIALGPGFFQRKELLFFSESECHAGDPWERERGEHRFSIFQANDIIFASYYNYEDCLDSIRAEYTLENFIYNIDFDTGSLIIPPTTLYATVSTDSIRVEGEITFPEFVDLGSSDKYVLSTTIENDAPFGLPTAMKLESNSDVCASIDYSFYEGEYCGTWNEYDNHTHINLHDESDGPIISFDYELLGDTLLAFKGPYFSATSNMLMFDDHVKWLAENPSELISYREQTYFYSKKN